MRFLQRPTSGEDISLFSEKIKVEKTVSTKKSLTARFKDSVAKKIAGDFIVLFAGRLVASGIGFFIGIITARSLGPIKFGVYSMAMVIFQISVVVAEMGIGTSLARFVPFYRNKDPERAKYYLMIGFWLLLGISLSVAAIGLLSSKTIALDLYNKPSFIDPIRLGFLAVIGGVLWSYYLASLQSRELFKNYSKSCIAIGVFKITLLVLVLYTIGLTPERVILVTIISSFVGFFTGKRFAPIKLIGVRGNYREAFSELMHFSKWIFATDVLIMLFSHLDILMLGYFTHEIVIGYYSMAYNIIFVFTIMTSSLINVLLPTVSKYKELAEFKKYIYRVLSVTLVIAIFLSPLIFLLNPVISFLLGVEYLASIFIAKIMFIGFLFNFVVEPIYLVSYAANKPQILTYVVIIKLILNAISNYILIPLMGATGAALATVVTNVIGGIIAIFLIHSMVFKKGRAAAELLKRSDF
jgi:O-antigen/teichoic acid export membrane protein